MGNSCCSKPMSPVLRRRKGSASCPTAASSGSRPSPSTRSRLRAHVQARQLDDNLATPPPMEPSSPRPGGAATPLAPNPLASGSEHRRRLSLDTPLVSPGLHPQEEARVWRGEGNGEDLFGIGSPLAPRLGSDFGNNFNPSDCMSGNINDSEQVATSVALQQLRALHSAAEEEIIQSWEWHHRGDGPGDDGTDDGDLVAAFEPLGGTWMEARWLEHRNASAANGPLHRPSVPTAVFVELLPQVIPFPDADENNFDAYAGSGDGAALLSPRSEIHEQGASEHVRAVDRCGLGLHSAPHPLEDEDPPSQQRQAATAASPSSRSVLTPSLSSKQSIAPRVPVYGAVDSSLTERSSTGMHSLRASPPLQDSSRRTSLCYSSARRPSNRGTSSSTLSHPAASLGGP